MANPFFNAIGNGGNAATQPQVPNAQGNLMQMLQQLRQNPMQFIMQRRFNVPQNLMNDPQAIVNHLVQSGQVDQNRLAQAQQIIRQMQGQMSRNAPAPQTAQGNAAPNGAQN